MEVEAGTVNGATGHLPYAAMSPLIALGSVLPGVRRAAAFGETSLCSLLMVGPPKAAAP